MGDHDRGVGDERFDRRRVDGAAGDHLIGDAGQSRDLGRNGMGGLPKFVEPADDAQHLAVGRVLELQHRELDHFSFVEDEAGGFGIEDDADQRLVAVALREHIARLQPAQHPEVGRLLEQASDVFELNGHGKLLFLRLKQMGVAGTARRCGSAMAEN